MPKLTESPPWWPQAQALYPALAGLPADLEAALTALPAVDLPAGAQLFDEWDPCQGFPLLLQGTVRVVKGAASGREMVLYRVEPGGSCIITSSCLLGQAPYSARGMAATALRLVPVPTPLFEALLERHLPFRAFVFHLFAQRIAELMQRVEEVAFQRLDQRLARLLLQRAAGLAVEHPVIACTHQQLAEELGSVREIVSRLLKGFADQGLVSLGREQVRLVDEKGLAALAQG